MKIEWTGWTDWEPEASSSLNSLLFILKKVLAAGHGGHAGLFRQFPRSVLQSERLDAFGTGSNKYKAALSHPPGEVRILREKSVSRNDCI